MEEKETVKREDLGVAEEKDSIPQDKSRGAAEYVKAVADAAAIVAPYIPDKKVSKALFGAAGAVSAVANLIAKLDDNPALELAKDKVPDGAKLALEKAAEAKGKLLDPLVDKRAERVSEKAAEKARKKARSSIIEAAESLSVSDFKKKRDTFDALIGECDAGFLAQPGCYVFLLKKGIGKDLAAYQQVYVGASSENMGAAIAGELEGFGNPDVYADAKYGQSLYILSYQCASEDVPALREALITALDANVSYNAREMERSEN